MWGMSRRPNLSCKFPLLYIGKPVLHVYEFCGSFLQEVTLGQLQQESRELLEFPNRAEMLSQFYWYRISFYEGPQLCCPEGPLSVAPFDIRTLVPGTSYGKDIVEPCQIPAQLKEATEPELSQTWEH